MNAIRSLSSRPPRSPAGWRVCLASVCAGLLPSGLLVAAEPPSPAPAEDASALRVVRPADNGRALVNPAMGWTLHFYSNLIKNYGSRLAPSDTLEDFPGLAVVYLRVPWAFLEPEEGRFDWSLLDTPAQRWISRGKQIALRVSCTESWMRYATPEWVARAGARGINFNVGPGATPDGAFWEPDYDDPVFLEKLDHFLAALAARYDGNPNIAFVDVGSYGVWGEGHTWASSRKEWGFATRKRHLDLYRKHFPHTLLALNDDFIGPDRRGARAPLTDYALTHGVTLRDDSILVQPPPHSWFHAELAQAFWPRLPVILEHEHYGPSVRKKAWSGDLLVQAVEDYHASYLSIHWWPREFLEANRETIRRINRRLGYRLQLREARWPARVTRGQPFTVRTIWANAGVAPCYPGGFVALTFKDAQGGIVSVHVNETFNVRDLEPGPPDQAPTQTVIITGTVGRVHEDGPRRFSRTVKPGSCTLYLSVGQRDGTPQLALPLDHGDGQHRYRLGSVELVK